MNPYTSLGDSAFWKKSIGDVSYFKLSGVWSPKFKINNSDKISTYGSCFAQHIAKSLQRSGYRWVNKEKAPKGMSEASKRKFQYEIYSSRSGNIYTASFFFQILRYAFGEDEAPQIYWEEEGRFVDPLRPSIEPGGFISLDEMLRSRKVFLESFKRSIVSCDVLVFTLGLTESWQDVDGFEYPICPGTLGGEFLPERHFFKNHDYSSVKRNLVGAFKLMKAHNPRLRILLTVSPVPLTATMSGDHVLPASSYSKSTLRAVAGDLSKTRRYIDYFPSYEIITSPQSRGVFYDCNSRSVVPEGVEFVMGHFFNGLQREEIKVLDGADSVCDEEVLESFSLGLGGRV